MSFFKQHWLWFFSFFIFLICLTYSFFIFLKTNQLDNDKHQKTTDIKSDFSSIKSSCRNVTKQDLFLKIKNKNKLSKTSSSLKKMDKLIKEPLDWMLQSLDGSILDLYCYRDKKKVFVNLWATWCPPCIEELPSLSKFAKKNFKEVLVVAVTTEPLGHVRDFLQESFSDLSKELKIARVSSEELENYFSITSLPSTYIFNKKALLEDYIVGAYDWSQYSLKKE